MIGNQNCLFCSIALTESNNNVQSESESVKQDEEFSLLKNNLRIVLQYLLKTSDKEPTGRIIFQDIVNLSRSLGGNLKLCSSCDQLASEINDLQLTLDTIQMKIVDKLKTIAREICNGSNSNKESKGSSTSGGGLELEGETQLMMDVISRFQTFNLDNENHSFNIPFVYIKRITHSTETKTTTKKLTYPEEDFTISSNKSAIVKEETKLDAPAERINLLEFKNSDLKNESRDSGLDQEVPPNKRRKVCQDGTLNKPSRKKVKKVRKPSEAKDDETQTQGENSNNINNAEQISDVLQPQKILQNEAQQLALDIKRRRFGRQQTAKKEVSGKEVSVTTDFCLQCSFRSTNIPRFEQHLGLHETSEKHHICPNCLKEFTHQQLFEIHVLHHCGAPSWKCDICEEEVNKEEIINHLESQHNTRTTYSCEFCECVFGSFVGVVLHFRYHKTGRLKCALCPEVEESFTSRKKLLSHLHDYHGFTQLLHKCDEPNCSKTFLDPALFKLHKKDHLKKFSCKLCDRILSTEANLTNHEKCEHAKISPEEARPVTGKTSATKIPVKLTEAQKLGKELRSRKLQRKPGEILKRTRQTIHICGLCSFRTYKYPQLEQHLREHETTEKYHQCPDCKEEFTQRQLFELHILHYCGTFTWKCDICKEAVNPTDIKEHLQSRHQSDTLYTCDRCGHVFATFRALIWHSRLHSDYKLKCTMCPFLNEMTRGSLFEHLYEIHGQTELLLKCEDPSCSRTFFDPILLYDHRSIHLRKQKIPVLNPETGLWTRETPSTIEAATDNLLPNPTAAAEGSYFTCDLCGFSAKSWYILQKHKVKSHPDTTGGHICDYCSKAFPTKYHLTSHRRSHTMEKPFQCDTCGASFGHQPSFKRHLKLHVDGKIYKPGPWTKRAATKKGVTPNQEEITMQVAEVALHNLEIPVTIVDDSIMDSQSYQTITVNLSYFPNISFPM